MATAFKILPKNYLSDWGEFESWAAGAASAPDGWIKGSSPMISQESSNVKFGLYSACVIGSTGAGIGGIYRTIPNGSDYAGRTFRLGVWGKSASTGPYIELNDGVTSKTVHFDGSNAFVFLTTPPMKLDYNATQIRVNLLATQNSTAYFDSAVLVEGEDLFTTFDNNITVANWEPVLNMRQDEYDIAQRDGSFIPDNKLQSRNIRLRGSVVGSDVVSTRNHFNGFMKSLLAWQGNEKRSLYLYDDKVTDVFTKGVDWNYMPGMQMIRFTVTLAAPDPTTRGIGKLRKRAVISGTVTEFNLSYNGTAESKPFISFIANQGADITTCYLENLTTQQNIIMNGTTPSGVSLDIDCEAGSVFKSSLNSINSFGTSEFMGLVRGTNYFRFTGSNCTINIDYFERDL